eukprot:7261614-Prymnesium_polylepis.2
MRGWSPGRPTTCGSTRPSAMTTPVAPHGVAYAHAGAVLHKGKAKLTGGSGICAQHLLLSLIHI